MTPRKSLSIFSCTTVMNMQVRETRPKERVGPALVLGGAQRNCLKIKVTEVTGTSQISLDIFDAQRCYWPIGRHNDI